MSHFVELRQTLPVFLHCPPNVCRILGEESAVQEAVAEGGRAVQGGREQETRQAKDQQRPLRLGGLLQETKRGLSASSVPEPNHSNDLGRILGAC